MIPSASSTSATRRRPRKRRNGRDDRGRGRPGPLPQGPRANRPTSSGQMTPVGVSSGCWSRRLPGRAATTGRTGALVHVLSDLLEQRGALGVADRTLACFRAHRVSAPCSRPSPPGSPRGRLVGRRGSRSDRGSRGPSTTAHRMLPRRVGLEEGVDGLPHEVDLDSDFVEVRFRLLCKRANEIPLIVSPDG